MTNQFEVQITTTTAPNVFSTQGWTTVYVTDSDCIEDAKQQMKYIMSTDQTRAQYHQPTAVRLIRNGVINTAYVGKI